MKKKIIWFCTIVGMSLFTLSKVSAESVENTFREFTKCDASFFKTLNRDAASWENVAPLKTRGAYSWIAVKNRQKNGENSVDFVRRPLVAKLKLNSYYDEFSDLGRMGFYYYWGFIVPGTVEEVAQQFKPLIYNSERLRQDGGSYVRTEVKVHDSRWLPLKTSSNTPTGKSITERVFLIEPHEKNKDTVRVSCSLQGQVSADILKDLRPDIEPKEYPRGVEIISFEDTKIPAKIKKIINREFKKNASWTPHFKSLKLTFITESSRRPGKSVMITEMDTLDGLVRKKEIYSPHFYVQRMMLANLVQLKAQIGKSSMPPVVASELKLSLPKVIEPDARLSLNVVQHPYPRREKDSGSQQSVECSVTEVFKASTLFSSLPGRAFRLSCMYDFGASKSKEEKAFLEDFGVAVPIATKSSSYGDTTYQIIKMDVRR